MYKGIDVLSGDTEREQLYRADHIWEGTAQSANNHIRDHVGWNS